MNLFPSDLQKDRSVMALLEFLDDYYYGGFLVLSPSLSQSITFAAFLVSIHSM